MDIMLHTHYINYYQLICWYVVKGTLYNKIWEESEKQLEKMTQVAKSSDCKQERIVSGKCLISLFVTMTCFRHLPAVYTV